MTRVLDQLARDELSAMEDATEALSDATEAVADAIAKKAKEDLSAEDLQKLAQAVAVMKFGAQGVTHYYYAGTYEQTYNSNQHETHHEGEKRTQPAGLVPPPAFQTGERE